MFHRKFKTYASHPLSFLKHFKRRKIRKLNGNIRNQAKIKIKTAKNSEQNCFNKEERKVKKIFLQKIGSILGFQHANTI